MVDLLEPSNVINRLYDSERFAELHDYCRALLQKDGSDTLALQNAALACLRLNEYEQALIYCGRVLEQDAGEPYALRNKIYALESLRRYGQVIECCAALLKSDPSDVWALNSAGLASAELDRLGDADDYFGRALQLDPRSVTALLNGALILGRLGRPKESISLYDRALQEDPSLREAAPARAAAYRSLGMADEAFLAEQGMLDSEIGRIISEARRAGCTVFHQLCLDEMARLEQDPHTGNPFRKGR